MLVAAVIVVGCTRAAPSAPLPLASTGPPSPPDATADPLGMTVLDAGDGPRVALRYRVPLGTRRTFAIDASARWVSPDFQWRMSSEANGQLELTEVDDAGNMRLRVWLADATASVNGVSPSMSHDPLTEDFEVQLSPRGELATIVPEGVWPLVPAFDAHLLLWPRLPDKPVGVGAQWTSEVPFDGRHGIVRTTYTLEALDGNQVRITARVATRVADWTPPPGHTVGTVDGAGAVETTLDLGTLLGASKLMYVRTLEYLPDDADQESLHDTHVLVADETLR